jgi:hypothetical protein
MRISIKAVHDYVASVAVQLRLCDRSARIRYACICYRDPVDSPADQHQILDFQRDPLIVREFLETVQAEGGGDVPEDFVGAVKLVLDLSWAPGAQRSVFLITDSPAHGMLYCNSPNHPEEESKLAPLVRQLVDKNVRFVALCLRSRAARTFVRFEAIYRYNNPELMFKLVKEYKQPGMTMDTRVTTIGRSLLTESLGLAADLLRDPESTSDTE